MGLFRLLFGNDSAREIHDEAHRSQYGYDVLEIKRTWLYTTEYGKIGSFDPKGNIFLDYNVENACRIRCETYLAGFLSEIAADTIALSIVRVRDIKDGHGLEWSSSGQFAVVDNTGALYGMIYDYDTKKHKLRPGDKIKVAVSRLPWTTGRTVLWVIGKIEPDKE